MGTPKQNKIYEGGVLERDSKGRFIKGYNYSPATQLKKGDHWRKKRLHWNKEWLYLKYYVLSLTASEIAKESGCTESNIYYWLNKHGIKRRDMSETRKLKKWSISGNKNGMFGKTGSKNPNWKGGISPERQLFYRSQEWKRAVRAVWKRDSATCQRCQKKKDSKDEFHTHHIQDFSFIQLRAVVSNLILLCKNCHNYIHSKRNKGCEFIMEINKIYQGDALEILKGFPSKVVNCCVTSPPYY